MAELFKFGAEFFEVVNLAIKDHPNRFASIGHRLVSSGQIDDRKPPEAQSKRARDEVTIVIGAAVDHGLGHSPDRFRFDRVVPREIKLAANAAHGRKTLNR